MKKLFLIFCILLIAIECFGIGFQRDKLWLRQDNNKIKPVTNGDVLYHVGTFGSSDTLDITGAGTRFVWYPRKAALRAGGVNGIQWDNSNIGDYSIAFGFSPNASGNTSTAFGTNTTASGNTSTAFGSNTTASGDYSTAFGYYATASGDYSVSSGRYMKLGTSADNSFVFGYDTSLSDSCAQSNTAYFFPYGETGSFALNQKTTDSTFCVTGSANFTGNFNISEKLTVKNVTVTDTLELDTENFFVNVPHAVGAFQDSSVTIDLTQDVWSDITNATGDLFTWSELDAFTNSSDSISTSQKHHCYLYFQVDGTGDNGDDFEFRVMVGGVQAPTVPTVTITSPPNGAFSQATIAGYLELETLTDYIKVQVRNTTGNGDITFIDGIFMTDWAHNVK